MAKVGGIMAELNFNLKVGYSVSVMIYEACFACFLGPHLNRIGTAMSMISSKVELTWEHHSTVITLHNQLFFIEITAAVKSSIQGDFERIVDLKRLVILVYFCTLIKYTRCVYLLIAKHFH